MPLLTVRDAELYHEVRGEGPPLLLIMGATGDGAHFDAVGDLLADEFTVVAYDRRGNGRSPRPPGWESTSAEEQADDAAALLEALGLTPSFVFGTSLGGVFALCLLTRHPAAVRGAILHEPAVWPLFDDPDQVRSTVAALVSAGIESQGAAGGIERFYRFVAGDANWSRLDPDLRGRILASADTYLEVERGRFDSFLPDDQTLAGIEVPVQVLVSDGSQPFFEQAAGRLAARLGVTPVRTPGTHFCYLDHPQQLVSAIRPFLREASRAASQA